MEDEGYTKDLGCSIISTARLMNHECIPFQSSYHNPENHRQQDIGTYVTGEVAGDMVFFSSSSALSFEDQ